MGIGKSKLYNQPTARAVQAAKKNIENRAIQNQMNKTATEASITATPPSPSYSQINENKVETFEMPNNKPKIVNENRIPDKAPELDSKILEVISKWDAIESKPDVFQKNLYDTQRDKMASAIRMKTNSLEKAAGRKAPHGLLTMKELYDALLLIRHCNERSQEEEAKRILGQYGVNEKDACIIIQHTSAPIPVTNKHDPTEPDEKDIVTLR